MSKIKQINISDFRVYEGTQNFLFENERGVANLIVLYAPNGFGKTSFFDAIEWGYSDKIKRLEQKVTNDSIKNEEDFGKVDKVILTNRNSYELGKKGVVEVITSGKKFTKEVVFRKIRGVETKNDYRPGKLINNSGFRISELNRLPETNVLSQDQIDSFLRYRTPEEKFTSLKEFWPQGESTLEKYKLIEITLKHIGKEFDENKSKVRNFQKELQEIVFDPQKIHVINSAIDKLESSTVLEVKYSKLGQNISRLSYDKLYKEISIARSTLDKEQKLEEDKKHTLDQLLEEFNTFSMQKKTLEDLLIEIKLVIEKRSFYQSLKSNKELYSELVSEQKSIAQKILEYRKIVNYRGKYISDIEQISQKRKTVQDIERTTKRFNQEILITENWITKLERAHKDCILKRDLQEDNYSKLDERIKLLAKYREDEKTLGERQSDTRKKLKDITDEIQTEKEILRKYKLCIERKDWDSLTFKQELEYWNQNINHLKELETKIKNKKFEIDSKTKSFNKSGNLNENINRIKIWGKEYIEETKVEFCPLCNSRFNSFEDLLNRILADKEDVLKIDELAKDIENCKKELNQLEVERSEFEILLLQFVNKRINEKEEKEEVNLKKQGVLLSDQSDNDSRLKSLKIEIISIQKHLEEYLTEGESFFNTSLPEIKDRALQNIDKLKAKISRIGKVLKWKENYKDSIKNKKNESGQIVQNSLSDIKIIENDAVFEELTELTKKLGLEIESLKEERYIANVLKDMEYLEKENKKKIVAIETKIKEYNTKIEESECRLEFDSIDGALSEKENNKEVLVKSIETYNQKYNRCVKDSKYSKEELNSEKEKSSNRLAQFEEYQHLLNWCNSDLELIQDGIKKSELEDKIQKIKKRNKDIEKLNNRVIEVQASCVDYIQKGISNYFNKDVINQIYKRIEPHPKLKEIDFRAEVGHNGPRLVITTKGNEDEVNPNLYLSAGQVNVLSLSIFLAKAFEYGKDTISTIFMDDPIQNLSDINTLFFIDILRTLTNEHDKQIVISTHDEKFFRLLQNKLPEEYCSSKYIEFQSEGKLKIK